MNTKNYVFAASLLACFSGFAQQQPEELDEVVVTDSKTPLKRENSGKVVVKITRAELEQNQGKSLAEIINSVSGMEINGSRSNAGQNLSYFVRGGNNRQVLVLIDGVQMTDPSQIANDFDLRLLDVNTIESIEIIKGAASTLYGSGAATAVINITTRKASQNKIHASITSVTGTNEAQDNRDFAFTDSRNNATVSGTLGKWDYRAGFASQYTDGLSAVKGDEADAFDRKNVNARVGYGFRQNFKVSLYANYDTYDSEYDNSFPLEDADFLAVSKQKRIGLTSNYGYTSGSLIVNAAYNKIERAFQSSFPSFYDSDSYVLDVYNRYNFGEQLHTVVGFNYVEGRTEFGGRQSSSNADPYANVVYVSDFGLNVNAGARLNNHSEYGSHVVYNANPSFTIDLKKGYLKFFGSYATSYIAPSLSQLYGPFGANADLQPEEDRTVEGGAELSTGIFRVSANYFNRLEENFIDYVTIDFDTFEGEYQNVADEFTVSGIEAQAEVDPAAWMHFRANYTFVENLDRAGIRIPKHRANALLGLDVDDRTFAQVNYQYTGSRTDSDFVNGGNVELDAFSLVDLYVSRTFFKNKLKLFAGVSNVFNEDYTELVGYTTKGRNVRFGLNLEL